jgi:hypothetical protein
MVREGGAPQPGCPRRILSRLRDSCREYPRDQQAKWQRTRRGLHASVLDDTLHTMWQHNFALGGIDCIQHFRLQMVSFVSRSSRLSPCAPARQSNYHRSTGQLDYWSVVMTTTRPRLVLVVGPPIIRTRDSSPATSFNSISPKKRCSRRGSERSSLPKENYHEERPPTTYPGRILRPV